MQPLRVKLLAKNSGKNAPQRLLRMLPKNSTRVGKCEFRFNRDARDYDWLVILDEIPKDGKYAQEVLNCHPANTLLITLEPPTIKLYDEDYLKQFGHVLSSHDPVYLRHPHHLHRQCGFPWFYGKPLSEIHNAPLPKKSKSISTVCSDKKQRHTFHHQRNTFTKQLQKILPSIDRYGHGVQPIKNKYDALDSYAYHLAIENHLATHHWTEKLADAFLGGCFPFYCGAPNVFDYFPEDSLMLIDIRQPEIAIEKILSTISDKAHYANATSAILEARHLVIEQYSLFPMLAKTLPALHTSENAPKNTQYRIVGRHQWRRENLIVSAKNRLKTIKQQRLANKDSDQINFHTQKIW